MPQLVEELKEKGVLRSPSIVRALLAVDRANFVPPELRAEAYDDIALPIGSDQTISQPYTVAFMLELLRVRRGDHVLDVGSGSGWQTALLAELVGPSGRVYALERVPGLCQQGKKNVAKYAHLRGRVEFMCASAGEGYAAGAPFDRIICAAEVAAVPQAWCEELAPGGRMVYPHERGLVLWEKREDNSCRVTTFPGFVFVPFIE